jgi:hypothetical protein
VESEIDAWIENTFQIHKNINNIKEEAKMKKKRNKC